MNNLINIVSFKAGLNNKILNQEKITKPDKIQEIFGKYGIETDFDKNKTISYANMICLEIFDSIKKRFNINYNMPPAIFAYQSRYLIEKNSVNFCIPDTTNVLSNDYPFLGRSIFFNECKNLKQINNITDRLYKNKEISSPHFLSPFIHEWFHSIHLDSIYSKYGYGGNCDVMKEIYPSKTKLKSGYSILKELETKTLQKQENMVVYDVLGKYSTQTTNQYLEIFSETLTMAICKSLDGLKLIHNPLEVIKNTPNEFQKIFLKVLKLE